jgi:hypothetical protein
MEEKKEPMAEEKLEAPEVGAKSKLLLWLDNFWYHYKWQTLLVAFLLLTFTVCFAQCTSQEKSDITVTFAGGYVLSEAEMNALADVLGSICPTDADEDGNAVAAFRQYAIFSEEELTEMNTYLDPTDGEYKFSKTDFEFDKSYNTDRYKNLQSYIMTGECAVWLVSPYVYESLLYSEDPRSNWVSQCVALKDTAFYQYFEAIQFLPEDTLIVILQPLVFGASSDEQTYAYFMEFYQNIVKFQAP